MGEMGWKRADRSRLEFRRIGGIIGAKGNRGSRMKPFAILSCVLTMATLATCQGAPERDYVPNSETAIAITEAVLIPVFGKKQTESERPYSATLNGGVWTVTGTLRCADGKPQVATLPTCVGGVAKVQISKKDARIVLMEHGK